MAALYKINRDIENILNSYQYINDKEMVDVDTGEVVPVEHVQEMFNQLGIDKEEKLDNYALVIKSRTADNKVIADEIKRLQGLKKNNEKTIEYLSFVLTQELNGEKREDKKKRYVVSFRKNKSTNIFNEGIIPSEYLVPQPPKVNKAEILRDLKAGKTVPGAEISENVSCNVK